MNEEISGAVETEAVEVPQPDLQVTETEAVEAEQSTETEQEVGESSENNQDLTVKKPKKGGYVRKIGKLEDKIAELEARLTSQNPPHQVQAEKPPALDDYPSWEEFNEADVNFKVQRAIENKQKQDAQIQAEAKWAKSLQEKRDNFSKQKDVLREVYDDLDDVLDGYTAPVPPALTNALFESDIGATLAYHLAKNPSEIERLSALSDYKMAQALGELEKKYRAPKQVEAKVTTKAPPPVSPVKTVAKSDSLDFETCSHEEYMAWRNKSR